MNNLSLQILDKSIGTRYHKKSERYQIFLGIGLKRYKFSSNKKAQKFLVSYQNRLNTLLDEFQIYHAETYGLYVESFAYLSGGQRNHLNDDFNHLIYCLGRLNSSHKSDMGFYHFIHQYVTTVQKIAFFQKEFYKKRRFNYLSKKSRYLVRQISQSIDLIESLALDYKEDLIELHHSEMPIITLDFNNQLRIVS